MATAFGTAAELPAKIRESIQKEKERNAKATQKRQIGEKLLNPRAARQQSA